MSRIPQYRNPGARSRGFTMLEALIALLVLAIGLLGMAGLQARSMSTSHNAYQRSQATNLAYEIIERMRARSFNPPVGTTAASLVTGYVSTMASSVPSGTNPGLCDDQNSNNNMVQFNSTAIADELFCWYSAVAWYLPGGSGSIAPDPNNNALYRITLNWIDKDNPGNPLASQTWTFEP